MNPFTDAYKQREVAFYNLKDRYDSGKIRVELKKMIGILPDYLNKNFRVDDQPTPTMFIDNRLWMSLSYMEVQSHYLPIKFAKGKVATAGLGLGYFALRAAKKKSVEKVDVYEINPEVIKFFLETFKHRKTLMNKINIIEGDVREKLKNQTYDLVFLDIYREMLEDKAIDDIAQFRSENDIGDLRVWGEERVFLDALVAHKLTSYVVPSLRQYFRTWQKTKVSDAKGERFTMASLYEPITSAEYADKFLGVLCD